jgi:hypothetical protein
MEERTHADVYSCNAQVAIGHLLCFLKLHDRVHAWRRLELQIGKCRHSLVDPHFEPAPPPPLSTVMERRACVEQECCSHHATAQTAACKLRNKEHAAGGTETDRRYIPFSGQPSVTSSTANGAFQLSSAGSCSLKKAVSAACDGLYLGSIFSIACTIHSTTPSAWRGPPTQNAHAVRCTVDVLTSVDAQEPSSFCPTSSAAEAADARASRSIAEESRRRARTFRPIMPPC